MERQRQGEQPQPDPRQPIRELRDSLFLIALMVSSLGAYLGIGVVAVRLFAGTR
jgi:hypothetical protein